MEIPFPSKLRVGECGQQRTLSSREVKETENLRLKKEKGIPVRVRVPDKTKPREALADDKESR